MSNDSDRFMTAVMLNSRWGGVVTELVISCSLFLTDEATVG